MNASAIVTASSSSSSLTKAAETIFLLYERTWIVFPNNNARYVEASIHTVYSSVKENYVIRKQKTILHISFETLPRTNEEGKKKEPQGLLRKENISGSFVLLL
jgi:hypothetical protein